MQVGQNRKEDDQRGPFSDNDDHTHWDMQLLQDHTFSRVPKKVGFVKDVVVKYTNGFTSRSRSSPFQTQPWSSA